ncbi:MAG: leucine-rich repeat protein [Kiritimatiellae bacterium]|nr:leucine-rich repeat protein [Kiritimatiellia bacterium]
MKIRLFTILAMIACAGLNLMAMPTENEMRQAAPKVRKLLSRENAALKARIMTRSEVADSAMILADKADDEASKLLFMKGAFILYARDGKAEKAIETLDKIESSITDISAKNIANMIDLAILDEGAKRDSDSIDKSVSRNSITGIIKGMVKIPNRDYWISETELTQGQWDAVMGFNESRHKGEDLPVEWISRADCDAFLEKLNSLEEVKNSPFVFTLPTHEEWRFAAMGGGERAYWIKPGVEGCILDMAWLQENNDNMTHPVATKMPNAYGLYDMQGNVTEWMLEGDDVKDEWTRKGCSFNDFAYSCNNCSASWWWWNSKYNKYNGVGMRLAAHMKTDHVATCRALLLAKRDKQVKRSEQFTEECNGYTWSYRIDKGEATIVNIVDGDKFPCAVSPTPTGNLVIPSSLGGVKVTAIGKGAFARCNWMTSVTIPDGVTHIARAAFYSCDALKEVKFPDSVRSIGWDAFCLCKSLETVELPKDLRVIKLSAFRDCPNLKSVTIPESVCLIEDDAFRSCKQLKSLVLPESVESIGNSAIWGCDELTTLVLPASLQNVGVANVAYCPKLSHLEVAAENPNFTAVDGVLYTKNLGEVVACVNTIDSVTIPSKVKKLRRYCFESCAKLERITLPKDVTTIQFGAFKNCTKLRLVTFLGERPSVEEESANHEVFYHCSNLKEIHVPADAKSWRGMKEWLGIPLVFDAVEENVGLGGVQLWEDGPYWAECNVGATKPEEAGYYFWWGDTVGYKWDGEHWNSEDGLKTNFVFSTDTPVWEKSNEQLMADGYVDSTGNLSASHDAVTAHLGALWRMPTREDLVALIEKCDTEWNTRNGVEGLLVKGRGEFAHQSIFLPDVGVGLDAELGKEGHCMSSTPHPDGRHFSCMKFDAKRKPFLIDYAGRCDGLPIRPVRNASSSKRGKSLLKRISGNSLSFAQRRAEREAKLLEEKRREEMRRSLAEMKAQLAELRRLRASPDNAQGLIHRWDFNGTLEDSVGGRTASLVGEVKQEDEQIVLAGGVHGSSYVDLGCDLFTGNDGWTIEIWGTEKSVKEWGRIFNIGLADDDILMSWSMGNHQPGTVYCRLKDSNYVASETCPIPLDTELHISMVIEQSDGEGNIVHVYIQDASTGNMMWKKDFDHHVSAEKLAGKGFYLGYAAGTPWNEDANAAYNEVRIWNRALSEEELTQNAIKFHEAGETMKK